MVIAPEQGRSDILREAGAAARHLARICFKTGPPDLIGVELEWTVHHAVDPTRPVDRNQLRAALGRRSPTTLDDASPADPLRHGGRVTVEPGGQLELSTCPQPSFSALALHTNAEIAELTGLLDAAGLVLGRSGIDPHRPPRPVVDTPRYQAMRCVFDRRGEAGRTMMYSTAGLQVCLDAGEPDQVAARWAAANALGPPMIAAFATADRHDRRPTGWASARMAAWLGIDPARTRPAWSPAVAGRDPVDAWTGYALTAPLLCVRGAGPDWAAPPGVSFVDWIGGALPRPPTTDDLEYHVSTLFPPVRPRGYLELRYLDTQPGDEWVVPVAVLAALFVDPATVDTVRALCAPVADRWYAAARYGLADPALARATGELLRLAASTLHRLDLPTGTRERVNEGLRRRLVAAERRTR